MKVNELFESIRVQFSDEPESTKQEVPGREYLGEMVYGGLDGIVTTFAVISGVVGGGLGFGAILIIGFSSLFADGFSMATGAFLSARSEQEAYDFRRQQEARARQQDEAAKREELAELYKEDGYNPDDARQLADLRATQPEQMDREIMIEQHGMIQDDRNAYLVGLATFIAFIVAGTLPLLVYVVGLFVDVPRDWSFPISVVLTGVALFLLGAAKVVVTRRNALRSGLEMLVIGGLAAGVAYGVGALLSGIGAAA